MKKSTLDSAFNYLHKHNLRDHPLVECYFNIIREENLSIKQKTAQLHPLFSDWADMKATTKRIDYVLDRLRRDLLDNKISDKTELEILIECMEDDFQKVEKMLSSVEPVTQ